MHKCVCASSASQILSDTSSSLRFRGQLAVLRVESAGASNRRSAENSSTAETLEDAKKWWDEFVGKEPEIHTCRQDVVNTSKDSTPSTGTTTKDNTKKKKNDAEGCVQGKDPDNKVYKAIQGKYFARDHTASYFRCTVTLMEMY